MDLSKHYGEAEAYSTSTRRDEAAYKRAGFEHRVDRLNESIKNAKSDSEVAKYQRLKAESVNTFHKYGGKQY